MVKSFADRRTEETFRARRARQLLPDVARRALRKREAVHVAIRVSDLRVPPGHRRRALQGDCAGQRAMAVNDQWRICFQFEDGDAYHVEFCDYH